MIPETHESNSIRLYKCKEFPLTWEYQHDIMKNVSAADSVVFSHNEYWWLLTNIANKETNNHSSKDPISDDWIEHKHNPVLFDSDIGRNAGFFKSKNGELIRGGQKQGFNSYGATELTENSYQEEKLCEISPGFFQGISGCHHLHSNSEYTVYDFKCDEIKA